MKELIVKIPDNKLGFFMELLKSLGFVKFKSSETDEDSKEEIIENIRQGWKEVNLIKQGKMKSRPAKDLIREIRG